MLFLKNYLNNKDFRNLLRGFNLYKDLLNNKIIKYTYLHDKQYKNVSIKFHHFNFYHLTGINYKRGSKLYKDLSDNKVNRNLLFYQKYTSWKLESLVHIAQLLNINCVNITESYRGTHLEFSNLIKSKKRILALAIDINSKGYYYCKSLLNLKHTNEYNNLKFYPIINIEVINTKEKE